MNKFVKENWFKIIIVFWGMIIIFYGGVFIKIEYDKYKIEKYCDNFDLIGKDDSSKIINCTLVNPDAKEIYESILKNLMNKN